jgi:hypothetical protein
MNFHLEYIYRSQRLRFLTDTQRGSTRREVAEEGEGTLVKAAAKLLVTAGEEVPVKKL